MMNSDQSFGQSRLVWTEDKGTARAPKPVVQPLDALVDADFRSTYEPDRLDRVMELTTFADWYEEVHNGG